MVFGLGTKKKDTKVSDAKSSSQKTEKKTSKGSQADEAAEILKKMEAKKDSGDCAFC